ncbi:MAG: gfo/Idh/MocA family oxidoreductase [Candidatus Omnitrophota bacterium]|jgi:predicted dehydrogenase|nr:MAG: gfo/Idh/MocA family oxidoreductase [Candidatus Omnitrophota bacterium]
MKFLILGLGSIGQRHCRILRQLQNEKVELYTVRTRNRNIVIHDNMMAEEGVDPLPYYGITPCASLDEALHLDLTAVFVTNPISMHVDTAISAAEKGHSLFIEKPLSHSLQNVERLSRLVEEKKLVTFVGYQLRFHPALEYIRACLQAGEIGDVYYADFHFGEWLPGMHPYEDYRESHAARKDQGGGVILCLSHEIDMAHWLFGFPRLASAVGGHISRLEMDVEDMAKILLQFDQDGHSFPVSIHLDFLQRPPRRECLILGEKGSLYWNYYTNQVIRKLQNERTPEEKNFRDFQRNDMFFKEIRQFIAALRGEADSAIPLQDGIQTLKICLAALTSLETGTTVSL